MEDDLEYCPLCEHDIDAGDCIENQDCIDGLIVLECLPEEFKKHENYVEICKACKWYHNGGTI